MGQYLSNRFADIKPYTPGEQPQDKSYIKLNTNESPFPPSPAVVAALSSAEAARLNLYPDPDTREAATAIASYYGVERDQVILGNGSDEVLAFCFQAYCDAQSPAVYADITYGFYKVFAKLYGIPSRVIPLEEDFSIDPRQWCNVGGTIFLANPNGPTGLSLSRNDIREILLHNPNNIVVVDEAYVDFGAETAMNLLPSFENLIVVQTMSKSRSLAGARLGYAIAHPARIAELNRMKFSFNPYNVNRLSLLAGAAAVNDEAYFRSCTQSIMDTREKTAKALRDRGFTVLKSAANFLFAKPGFLSGEAYYIGLKERGILVRQFPQPARIAEFVRITIGTEEQMHRLLEETDALMEKQGV